MLPSILLSRTNSLEQVCCIREMSRKRDDMSDGAEAEIRGPGAFSREH